MRECNYCLRHLFHGGKCQGKGDGKSCLIFQRDPRGRREYLENDGFKIPFHVDIPEVGKINTDWEICGIAKTLTFTKIRKVEWHSDTKGLHGVYLWADYWYWSDENGELPPSKPKLSLVKNSGGE